MPIFVVASLFTSKLAAMERVAKASSDPADPLATSSSAAYSTLHRLAGATGESPLLYQAPAACDAWELLAYPHANHPLFGFGQEESQGAL